MMSPSAANDAVLLVGHGTVSDIRQLPEFLSRIRRGRLAPPDLIQELERRYAAIGGSPLLGITQAQAAGLSQRLGLPVHLAMRFWSPTIQEVLPDLEGYGRLVVLPLAPFSVHIYTELLRDALTKARDAGRPAPELVSVGAYAEHPAFLAASYAWLSQALRGVDCPEEIELVLSAHSLPVAVLRGGDPYQVLFETCAARLSGQLMADAGLSAPARVAYQSQGAASGEWLGPDLQHVLSEVARAGRKHVLVAPLGFVADHVETLFDLDVEAQGWATDLGLSLTRPRAHNADARFLDALAAVAGDALAGDAPAGDALAGDALAGRVPS